MLMLAAASLSASLLHAQSPDVDRILQRFVKALGGRAALTDVKSMVVHASVRLPGIEASGTTVEYFSSGNRFAAITEIPGYGTVSTVYDGRTAWQTGLDGEVSEISGAELADIRRRADLHWNLKLAEFYPGLEVRGRAKVDGRDAWKLEATVDNWLYDFYFDVRSGLLVRLDTDRLHGTSSVTIGDYRRVGRVLFAFSSAEANAPLAWSQTLTGVTFNCPVNDQVFAKPETTTLRAATR